MELLENAEEWAALTIHTDEDGDLCGGSKIYIDDDNLTALFISTGLRDIVFGRAIMNAAVAISHAITGKQGTTDE